MKASLKKALSREVLSNFNSIIDKYYVDSKSPKLVILAEYAKGLKKSLLGNISKTGWITRTMTEAAGESESELKAELDSLINYIFSDYIK